MPNFKRYAAQSVRNPNYDPGNEFTVAWQSGITGIAYDTDNIDREITSVKDLWDPAFKGKVGMMADDTELGSVGMLALGIDPKTSTPADWERAADLLRKQRDEGIVRQYYDQSYIKALQQGDTWISMAWSGDVFQAQLSGNQNLKFVVPDEGVMFWQDNCMIPLHAAHPVDAMVWIDLLLPAEGAGDRSRTGSTTSARSPTRSRSSPARSTTRPSPTARSCSRRRRWRAASSPTTTPRASRTSEKWTSIFDPIIQS